MRRSFHWIGQECTLRRLQEHTEPGGGVAILDDWEWLTHGRAGWQEASYEVVAEFVDDLSERQHPDEVEHDQPWDELLAEEGLVDVEVRTFDVERTWDLDRIVAYVGSLSFASTAVRGADGDALERALRERVQTVGVAPFTQTVEVRVIAGAVEGSMDRSTGR